MLSLNDWLLYLENLSPGLSSENNSSFEDTKAVAAFLNIDNFSCPVITIAGTNGKGSCVAFLDAIWREAGFAVGAYTSPHLLRYNERICLNGEEASDAAITTAFAVVDEACKKLNITLNYFAFTTLTAFLIFKSRKLDVVILEVGLGGRLDPVNIIDPSVSVITTISLDHVNCLGDTREKIGYEKSGIMRSQIPIVCGDYNPPQSIFAFAKEIGAPLFCANRDFGFIQKDNSWFWFLLMNNVMVKQVCNLPITKLSLQDAAAALMVVELMRETLLVSSSELALGLQKTFLLGRFQWLKFSNNVKCVIDVAHNNESASLLAANLKLHKYDGRTLAIVSILKDKNIAEVLKPLVGIVDEWYVCQLQVNRGASLQQLREAFKSLNLHNVNYIADVNAAIEEALKNCDINDRIVSFGSFYMVAEVLKYRYSRVL